MKKIYNYISCAAVALLSLSSCSPEIPQDETLNKKHGDPHRAEYILAEGHIRNGEYVFEQYNEKEGVRHIKKQQKIVFNAENGGKWEIEKGSAKEFKVLSVDEDDKESVFALIIRYYDKKGDDITLEFVQDGQDQIHQHFFMLDKVEPTFNGEHEKSDTIKQKVNNNGLIINKNIVERIKENFFYRYCDSSPYNKSVLAKEATTIGDKNPIGFKGYFKFYKERKAVEMRIPLMHARTSKFKNGKPSPYYLPTAAQRGSEHWDIEVKIPIKVYASAEDMREFNKENKTNINELSPKDKRLIESVEKAFSISKEEAFKEITNNQKGNDKQTTERVIF